MSSVRANAEIGADIGDSFPRIGLLPRTRVRVGLSDLVAHHLHQDPLNGYLYVFTNRRRNRIKLLYFDG